MTNVLITGITGFIGSQLARRLSEEGYRVFGMLRHATSRDLKALQDILPQISLLQADLRDYLSVKNVVRASSPDHVCHLGALTPVRYSFEHPFEYEDVNYRGSLNLVHALLEAPDYRSRRLVVASTAEVYGWQNATKPFREDAPLHPASPYAVSKAAMDDYVQMCGRVYDLNYTILRPTNSYGRRLDAGFIVEYIITSMLKNEEVFIGTPDSVRDYLYVDDHVRAYLQVLAEPKANRQVLNVSSGRGKTNTELAEKIAEVSGYKKRIVYGVYPPNYPQRPAYADPSYLVLSNEKIKRVIGWRPQTPLDEGLTKTIRMWREFSSRQAEQNTSESQRY